MAKLNVRRDSSFIDVFDDFLEDENNDFKYLTSSMIIRNKDVQTYLLHGVKDFDPMA